MRGRYDYIDALPYAGMIQIRFSGSGAGASDSTRRHALSRLHRLPEQVDTIA
jgi:hypothetical protein